MYVTKHQLENMKIHILIIVVWYLDIHITAKGKANAVKIFMESKIKI